MENKLVIIDGSSLFYRAFYALPPLTNLKGEYSNAIYGFANEVIKIIQDFKPTHMVVCFDISKHTFRTDIFDGYKATRKPMPTELASQIPGLKEMLKIMNIKLIEKEGYEADDLIGTISKKYNTQSIIFTGDRDSFQLIDKLTSVCYMKKGISVYELLTDKNIKDFYGVEASQVVDLKALQGDASDNIPGVAGIGPKSATDLINEFKTLDNVYANLDKIKEGVANKLKANKDNAYLSQTLATIKTDIALNETLDDFKIDFPFDRELLTFFERFNIRSLTKRAEIYKAESQSKISQNLQQINKIESLDELKKLVLDNQKADKIALYRAKNGELHFSLSGEEYVVFPPADLFSIALNDEDVLAELKPILENKNVTKVYLDAKKMFYFLKDCKIKIDSNIFDISVATNCVRGIVIKNNDDVFEYFGNNKNLPASSLLADFEELKGDITTDKLKDLVYNVEFKLIFTLFEMEQRGFKIDQKMLDTLEEQYKTKMERLVEKIYSLAGCEFNVNSPKQLAYVLFDKLSLPKSSKGSTSADVLESYLGMHDIIPVILEYRKASKFYGTYLAGMREHIEADGAVRTNFNQALTATGRLSSSEPNLQNIPIRSEEGREVRSLFTASKEGNVLVDADYSQIELRVLAHLSDDEFYLRAFKNNEDIHNKTACEIFRVEPNQVTDVMRRIAKVVNFGVVYGISEYGLSGDLKITAKEARNYIEEFFRIHPNIDKFMKNEINFAKENGFVLTDGGRKRLITDIKSNNFNVRTRAERIAQNTCIQGTAAEIIKKAMNAVEEKLVKSGLKAKLIMQVHDELVVDCPKDEVSEVEKILTSEMEGAYKLKVPLKVNLSVAYRWGEAH